MEKLATARAFPFTRVAFSFYVLVGHIAMLGLEASLTGLILDAYGVQGPGKHQHLVLFCFLNGLFVPAGIDLIFKCFGHSSSRVDRNHYRHVPASSAEDGHIGDLIQLRYSDVCIAASTRCFQFICLSTALALAFLIAGIAGDFALLCVLVSAPW